MSEPITRLPSKAVLLTYLQAHLTKPVSYARLRDVAEMDDVPRQLREFIADGWPIEIDGKAHARMLREPMRPPRGDRKTIGGRVRTEVLEIAGGRCQLCGKGIGDLTTRGEPVRLEVDHIVPRSRGGKTEISNLRALCQECNHDRGNGSDPL